ncbi:hypothetical protein GX51_08288 [Blastomyces parvus]|uniref:Uncharacterized protein n=1 Tax=Blastomyces parvus TaxID=2060905 RepID=A0A2B7WFP9_9EURO|nr:hypothetical protein GX51_08288 [Blastomyces parvus]
MPMPYSKFQSQPIEHTSKQDKPTPTATPPKQSYADRHSNQFIRNSPAARLARQTASREQQRRDIFLNQVKRDRDKGRFDARSEQIQRINFLAQQRRHQEAIARAAPDVEPLMEEVEGEGVGGDGMVVDLGAEGKGGVEDERILVNLISQEEEYQAFLKELDRSRDITLQSQQGGGCPPSSQYDEEEDYESIFAELLDDDDDDDDGRQHHQQHQHQHTDQNDSMNDGMDMSCG